MFCSMSYQFIQVFLSSSVIICIIRFLAPSPGFHLRLRHWFSSVLSKTFALPWTGEPGFRLAETSMSTSKRCFDQTEFAKWRCPRWNLAELCRTSIIDLYRAETCKFCDRHRSRKELQRHGRGPKDSQSTPR